MPAPQADHPQQAEQAQAEQAVARLLQAEGARFTPARRLVVRALAEAAGPQSAGDLHAALGPALPLSSLYRTLAVLADARVLAKEHDGGGVGRYELAKWLVGHHHHLVCLSCGEVRDVGIDPQTEKAVTRLVKSVAARTGYRATGHRIDIEGTCAACRTA